MSLWVVTAVAMVVCGVAQGQQQQQMLHSQSTTKELRRLELMAQRIQATDQRISELEEPLSTVQGVARLHPPDDVNKLAYEVAEERTIGRGRRPLLARIRDRIDGALRERHPYMWAFISPVIYPVEFILSVVQIFMALPFMALLCQGQGCDIMIFALVISSISIPFLIVLIPLSFFLYITALSGGHPFLP